MLEKIPDEKTRGFILKNIQRTTENSFIWKLNAESLRKNLDNIMEGIERQTDYSQQISGFPVIFLKGADSDYLPTADFRDILKIFPAADFKEVPGATHWIHVDRPDAVVKYIMKLLQ